MLFGLVMKQFELQKKKIVTKTHILTKYHVVYHVLSGYDGQIKPQMMVWAASARGRRHDRR